VVHASPRPARQPHRRTLSLSQCIACESWWKYDRVSPQSRHMRTAALARQTLEPPADVDRWVERTAPGPLRLHPQLNSEVNRLCFHSGRRVPDRTQNRHVPVSARLRQTAKGGSAGPSLGRACKMFLYRCLSTWRSPSPLVSIRTQLSSGLP
jgi:hypothetical protein